MMRWAQMGRVMLSRALPPNARSLCRSCLRGGPHSTSPRANKRKRPRLRDSARRQSASPPHDPNPAKAGSPDGDPLRAGNPKPATPSAEVQPQGDLGGKPRARLS